MREWADLSFGRYIYNNSVIHHVDPVVKLIALFLIGLDLMLLKAFIPLFLLSFLLLLSIFLAEIPADNFLKSFKLFLWLFFFIIIFYSWSWIRLSQQGVNPLLFLTERISIVFKWLLMIGFCFLLTMTTSPREISASFDRILWPLNKIGIPVHDMVIMIGLVLHFLPMLKIEIERLIKIRKIQGADIKEGSVVQRIYNLKELVLSCIHILIRRSEKVAIAMEARGYSGNKIVEERTSFFNTLHKKDLYAFIIVIFFLLITLYINTLIK